MAKRLTIVATGLFVLLLIGGTALAAGPGKGTIGWPWTKSLEGTAWTGNVTYLPTGATETTTESVTLSVATQEGYLITGTSTDPTGTTASIAFSGVIGSYGQNCILMTAQDYVAFGELVKRGKSLKLLLRGGSTGATGGSFYGELTKQ